ncbi:MAG: sugar phosphate isomerase/epimerase [Caldilineaceae bacterium]|nr:sugar phosphate isomerase/epimerase [Caldilineaceae bacterium]
MQFGCCCSIEQAEIARQAGFDYWECTVVSLLPEANEAIFAPVLEKYQLAPLPVRACNVFLPGDLKVVGPMLDHLRLQSYVRTALRRVHLIGADVVVFGSGKARMVPDGFDRALAEQQLVDFLHFVGEVASTHGITVVIEPLNRQESNIVNRVAEGVTLAARVNHPSIQVLADFYHMDEEQEPLYHLTAYKDWLAHIHVADSGRRAPGTGSYPYAEFADLLRQANYQGMVSIECRWEDFAAEAGPACRFLHQVFA